MDVHPPQRLDVNMESAPALELSSELNRANVILEGLLFSPATDFYGSVVVNVDVNDGGASGRGGVLSANSTISIDVTPVNDGPAFVVPRVHRRSGGRGPMRIEEIEIDDVDNIDGQSVTVSVVANEGSVTVDPSPKVLISTMPREQYATAAGVSVVGLLDDVRRALSHAWFVPPSEGWEGGTEVQFFGTDGQGATGVAESVVVITDPDIEPILSSVNDTFVVDQGISTPLVDLNISDLVVDAAISAGNAAPAFNVTISAEEGGVGLSPVPPGLSPVPGSETATTALAAVTAGEGLAGIFGTPRSTLSFRGTLHAVNTALESLVYVSANGTTGLGRHTVTMEVKRKGKLREHSARLLLAVDVRPVNKPPVIHWNATAYVPESPEIGGFSLRGLRVVDDDLAHGGLLSVRLETLTAEDSVVVRSAGDGLVFSGESSAGVPSSVVAFRGNATSVAEALSASAIILDSPGAFRALVPALRVTVKSDSNDEASQVVEVYGSHVNSPPEVRIGNPDMAMKEGGVLERVGESAEVEVHDVDAEDSSYGFLEVNVSVSHRAVLETQNITTSATPIHPVQVVTTRSAGGGNSTIGGTFNLTLDLSHLCDGCGNEVSKPIWHDAVGNEDDVRVGLGSGGENGESIQAKLEALPSLQALGITVFCQRNNELNLNGGREWRVTFLDGPASLPLMQTMGDSLIGDMPYAEVSYAVKGNSLSGSFTLSLGGYKTDPIRHDASADDVAVALEAIPSVTAVDVTNPYATDPQGGRHWTVTFFDALDTGGDLPLMEVDGGGLGGRGAVVAVVEAVRGDGIAELWEVATSAAHQNFVSVITLTGALQTKGYFQLGLELDGRREWTRPIYPQAVGSINDEAASWWSFGGIPGRRKGESVEARLRSLKNWKELGPDAQAVVNRVHSADGDTVQWTVTFTGTPAYLEAPTIQSARLTGGAAVSAAVSTMKNKVQGFFSLAYGGIATPPLSHDSVGRDIAAAVNALESLHSSDIGTGVVLVARTQDITLEGGRRWVIAFLSDPEVPANFTAIATSATGLSGASASASVRLLRQGGRGAVLRLVDLGGAAFGLPGYTTGERLTVRGKQKIVTEALSSLSYSPRHGWNGRSTVILRVYDGGFTGLGGEQSGWGIVNVDVEPVNNPPELLWCGSAIGSGGVRVEGVDEDAPFRLVDYDCDGGGTPATPTAFDHADLGGPDTGLYVHDLDGGVSLLQVG